VAIRGIADETSIRTQRPRWPLSFRILLVLFALPLVGFREGRAEETKEIPLHYTPGNLTQAPMHGQEIVKPFRIMSNVYYVGLSNNAIYLITTPEGHFLLDQGFESTAPYIANSIEQLGFHVKDIKYLIQAHAHVDHIDGLAAFKRLAGKSRPDPSRWRPNSVWRHDYGGSSYSRAYQRMHHMEHDSRGRWTEIQRGLCLWDESN